MGIGIRRKEIALLLLFHFFYFSVNLHCGIAIDTITATNYIRDPESIVSSQEDFKLGFFSPGNTTRRYVGIWFSKIPGPTIVWVANRENPLMDSSGVVTIDGNGNLVVLDGQENVLWSTNVSNAASNSSVVLLDSGNLVLREGNSNGSRVLWQSFDQPTDTLLPTMKIGTNLRTGDNKYLTSWRSASDPSIGNFSLTIGPLNEIPQGIIWNNSYRYWRSGPWNNRIFIGIPRMHSSYLNGFNMNIDTQEKSAYMTFSFLNQSPFTRVYLNSQGNFIETEWNEVKKEWDIDWFSSYSNCDIYSYCGPFGSCNPLDSPICSCLRGFVPKYVEEWNKGNWSGGCLRRTELQCERNSSSSENGKSDGFLKLGMTKVPDFPYLVAAREVEVCEEWCSKNCSCKAYAYDTGIGCMWWTGDLVDIQKFPEAGVELHIRVAYSELDKKRDKKIIIITIVLGGTIALGVCSYMFWRWMVMQRGKKKKGKEMLLFDQDSVSCEFDRNMLGYEMKQGKGGELPLFNFEKLAIATNNFHVANKLGQGGFGPVYKGMLPEGQEIAVKRLSKSSGQGLEEFKNEVIVISKLQHRNLVRLLGCCIEGEEKMLIYEYMPNKSLDAFLFDANKRILLDWRKRFHIIEGISRGLLYLHRDSRLRIIHRDLKASNILLDEGLNPKISDFGTARIFGGDQDEANTIRLVGTYGYMSPEYAMEGTFSEKSDVFSFGVLLLEIVSGKKNTSFYHNEQCLSLLRHAWQLWNEDKILALVDTTISETSLETEILRCIHVGLLCVQEFAKDRPTVCTIISMLNSEIAVLPTPKQPAFTERQIPSDTDSFPNNQKVYSLNNVTITAVEGR